MKRMIAVTLTLALWSTIMTKLASAATQPIPILLVDGQSGGSYHVWQLTTLVLKKELDETGLFAVSVATAPHSDGDFSNFKPNFAAYQAIVWNYDAPDWPADLSAQLEDYVKNGGGLVIVHGADNAFPNWQAYNQMAGIGGWRDRSEKSGPYWYFKDGKLVSDRAPGPAGSHGARLPFQLVSRDPEHPIMKGLPPAWMHTGDELYARLRGPGENMTVLATAHSDPANKGTDLDEIMLMVVKYGKGRVFHTTMGHDVAALSCVGFMTTYQRGTEWAATGRVTQSVPASFPTENTVSFRVDIAKLDPAFVTNAPTAPPPASSADHGINPVPSTVQTSTVQKGSVMTAHASGPFEVKLDPQTPDGKFEDATMGRMTIAKQFHGDLEATSRGQMLTALTDTKGSAGYVAIERVSGTLKGRSGSFALQHTGTMNRNVPQLSVTVVPDSGTGQLVGLAGKMDIKIADGKHSYEFEYTLPEGH
jgi:type 1 glutamine amidotransferase